MQPSVKTRRCSGAESGQREVRAGHNVADLDYYISTAVHQHVLHYTIVVKNKAQCFLLQCNSHDKRVFTAKKEDDTSGWQDVASVVSTQCVAINFTDSRLPITRSKSHPTGRLKKDESFQQKFLMSSTDARSQNIKVLCS